MAAGSRLTDFTVLCFDVYGILVDWESGIFDTLNPHFHPHPIRTKHLHGFAVCEAREKAQNQSMQHSEVLASVVLRNRDGHTHKRR